MVHRVFSWLRETGRLTLGYLAVGACFAVSGLLLFCLQLARLKGFVALLPSLAVGFLLAYSFWRWFEKPNASSPQDLTVTPPQEWIPAELGEATSLIITPETGFELDVAPLCLQTNVDLVIVRHFQAGVTSPLESLISPTTDAPTLEMPELVPVQH